MASYYCPEVSLYCLLMSEDLRHAAVKGGFVDFDPSRPFEPVHVEKTLMLDRGRKLSDFADCAESFTFTRVWKVLIGYYPNGAANVVSVYGE